MLTFWHSLSQKAWDMHGKMATKVSFWCKVSFWWTILLVVTKWNSLIGSSMAAFQLPRWWDQSRCITAWQTPPCDWFSQPWWYTLFLYSSLIFPFLCGGSSPHSSQHMTCHTWHVWRAVIAQVILVLINPLFFILWSLIKMGCRAPTKQSCRLCCHCFLHSVQ